MSVRAVPAHLAVTIRNKKDAYSIRSVAAMRSGAQGKLNWLSLVGIGQLCACTPQAVERGLGQAWARVRNSSRYAGISANLYQYVSIFHL